MDNHGSITGLVACLIAKDEHAAQRLYERYLLGLMTVAKARLRGARRGMADEEDLAHQALTAFFDRVRQGGFPQLADRHDVWQVLVMLTERRVADHLRRGCRRKRGNGIEQGESSIPLCGVCVCQARPIEQVVAQAPGAEAAAEFMELYQRLMDSLDDFTLKQIAAWRIEGWTTHEIAQRLRCTPRTVERKLTLVRKLWQTAANELSVC